MRDVGGLECCAQASAGSDPLRVSQTRPAPSFTLFLESQACCLGCLFSTEGLGRRKENALPDILHVLLPHPVPPSALVWKDDSRLLIGSWELMLEMQSAKLHVSERCPRTWILYFSLLRTTHRTHTLRISSTNSDSSTSEGSLLSGR